MRNRSTGFLLLVVVAACSREVPGPIRKDPADASHAVLRAVDLVLATGTASPRAGERVPMVAIVGAEAPPRALALGFVLVPLADGAIPAVRALPGAGHHEVRLFGTVLGTGRSARYAVDEVTQLDRAPVTTTIAEIEAHPDDYDERRVAVVGTLTRGEERSTLDEQAWLSGCSDLANDPKGAGPDDRSRRVAVVGWAFTRTHGTPGFGHTNAYRLHIEADRCEPAP